jgi:hypothetical protein
MTSGAFSEGAAVAFMLRDTESENLHQAVPLHHDFCRFERLVNDLMTLGMIKRLANLPRDVLQVPDGKTFVARQCRGDRITLNIFRGRQQQIPLVAYAIKAGDIVAAKGLCALRFFEDQFSSARPRSVSRSQDLRP